MNTVDIQKMLVDLFPLNRSLTGAGLEATFQYIKENHLKDAVIKSIKSGTKVFDWTIPPEWTVKDAYVKNSLGKKIIDITENNIHLMSYSTPFFGTLSEEDMRKKLHTLSDYPDWIPYRTSYYSENWSFCCKHSLLSSEDFKAPFDVVVDTQLDYHGSLKWMELPIKGELEEEILISTYCCHPSLANDNLSGVVVATLLCEWLKSKNLKYSYRLVMVPETIGAIAFLQQADVSKVLGGMILTCLGGPGQFSLKEGFDPDHWINQAAHIALKKSVGEDYKIYPFVPQGSDERQYASPGFRIVTPSIHKDKYYDYDEYHTSADNLSFVSSESLQFSLNVYQSWIEILESLCIPRRKNPYCEYQLGQYDLYPTTGGSSLQKANSHSNLKSVNEKRKMIKKSDISEQHVEAITWLMYMADGTKTNFEISRHSKLNLELVNEAIALLIGENLLEV